MKVLIEQEVAGDMTADQMPLWSWGKVVAGPHAGDVVFCSPQRQGKKYWTFFGNEAGWMDGAEGDTYMRMIFIQLLPAGTKITIEV